MPRPWVVHRRHRRSVVLPFGAIGFVDSVDTLAWLFPGVSSAPRGKAYLPRRGWAPGFLCETPQVLLSTSTLNAQASMSQSLWGSAGPGLRKPGKKSPARTKRKLSGAEEG